MPFLIGADGRTHGRIVATALTAAMGLAALASTTWRTDRAAAELARAEAPMLKAAAPAHSAATRPVLIR